jgi:DNA (cytosine-5)-methyltransferase 1
MFPDDWEMCGSITDRYRQIGNAVPVGLGEAVGRAILAHINGVDQVPPQGFPFSRYKGTDHVALEAKMIGSIDSQESKKPKMVKNLKKQSKENKQTLLFEVDVV